MAQGYGNKPLWQWIVIYAVIGLVIYGAVYYFLFANKGNYNSNSNSYVQPPQTTQATVAPVAKNAIQITNFKFSPDTLTVKVGDKVTWTNNDSAGHSATADDSSFDTGVLATGQSATVTFNKPGTVSYHCSVHPMMKGTIIVPQ